MNITAGKFKGQKIIAPDSAITRPTLSKVRMSVFNTLQSLVEFEGGSFLDMFAGSGIMSLEAISRGFTEVIAIEKHHKVLPVIKSNFSKFQPKPKLISGDSLRVVKNTDKKFGVIYIDPPYFSGIYEACLSAVRNLGGIIVLEHVSEVDFGDYEIVKQKKYGDKFITYLKNL